VLKKIVYNHYREYEDYLYILRGDEKQDKSIELCLECIENYIATNGAQLQTLNGIIDLTIRESNYIAPQVSFDMMSSLLQNCQGGLLQNIQFKGFGRMIGYYQLDYKTLSTESLYSIHKNFINLYTRIEIETIAEGYPDIDMETGIQKIDKNGKPLFVPMSTKKRTIIKGYEDIINIFGCVSEEESDYSLVEKRLKSILSRYDIHKNNDNEWQIDIVNQDKIIEIIVNNFLKPTKYLFTFNDKISIGNNLPFSMTKDEVKNNIVNYLQPFIINQLDENNYEIQCSKEELEKIKVELRITSIQKNTHTKGKQNEPNDEYIFLKREHQRSLCYCNPSVNKSKHSILGRKFLWCERKPCYYSCIRYNESPKNLIDFLHILNHDIVIDSQCAGLIPNRVYSQFMDQLNKSITIYEAMICKECGHILFPQKKGRGYYYYYACKNEKCSNHGKWIYLNNCYKCGANIDSRTTNKCPNGIHICPHCLTCCSDDHFKRLKKNQIAEYGESTPWIDERQGKGHNDKGKYFCPKCGKELSHEKECYNCHYQHKEE